MSSSSLSTITAPTLSIGDVCMFEIRYQGRDQNYKLWFDTIDGAEITLIDGIRIHPWLDPNVLNEDYINRTLNVGDVHEFGDSYYNYTYPGMGYVFIKATELNANVVFNYGYKPLFPKWIIYAAGIGGGVILLGCLFICCCYIRRL